MFKRKFCVIALCVFVVAATDPQQSTTTPSILSVVSATPVTTAPANTQTASCTNTVAILPPPVQATPVTPPSPESTDSYTFYKPTPDTTQKTQPNPAVPQVNNEIKGWTNIIVGEQNKVVGGSNIIVGQRSKILGEENKVSGNDNLLLGSNNVVKGSDNLAKGDENKLLGDCNTVKGSINQIGGMQNQAVGQNNLILGMLNRVRGDNNLLKGQENNLNGANNQITGSNNDVLGLLNTLTGDVNKVKGNINDVSGDKNAVKGSHNNITGDNNMIAGNGNYIGSKFKRISSTEPKILIDKSDQLQQVYQRIPEPTVVEPSQPSIQPRQQQTVTSPSITIVAERVIQPPPAQPQPSHPPSQFQTSSAPSQPQLPVVIIPCQQSQMISIPAIVQSGCPTQPTQVFVTSIQPSQATQLPQQASQQQSSVSLQQITTPSSPQQNYQNLQTSTLQQVTPSQQQTPPQSQPIPQPSTSSVSYSAYSSHSYQLPSSPQTMVQQTTQPSPTSNFQPTVLQPSSPPSSDQTISRYQYNPEQRFTQQTGKQASQKPIAGSLRSNPELPSYKSYYSSNDAASFLYDPLSGATSDGRDAVPFATNPIKSGYPKELKRQHEKKKRLRQHKPISDLITTSYYREQYPRQEIKSQPVQPENPIVPPRPSC